MRRFLAALALLVVILVGSSRAGQSPPNVVPAPIQLLPHDAGVPELDPGLEGLFDPIERVLGKPVVVVGKPIIEPRPAPNPCDEQGDNCVVAYRFEGEINNASQAALGKFFEQAKKWGAKRIMLEMTTNGGYVNSGHEMSRTIEMFTGAVICVADGDVSSMGVYVLESCDVRVMTTRSVLLVHQVLEPVEGAKLISGSSTEYLNATQLRAKARSSEVATEAYLAQVASRSNMTTDQMKKKVAHGDWKMNSKEALKVGLVDQVIVGAPNRFFTFLKAQQP